MADIVSAAHHDADPARELTAQVVREVGLEEFDATLLIGESPDGQLAVVRVPLTPEQAHVRFLEQTFARLEREIGRGGMATVYRDPARSTIDLVGTFSEDVEAVGWSRDGRPVGQANTTLHSLWRFTPARLSAEK